MLSITYSRPRALQMSPMPLRSATCVRGLAMVSTKTRRVFGCTASATACAEVASTNVTSTPMCRSVSNTLLVLPNRKALETTWSPARSRVENTATMPAMPVAKHAVAKPPSIMVILASSAAVVGLPWRA